MGVNTMTNAPPEDKTGVWASRFPSAYTILFWSENAISDLSSVAYINAMYWIEILMSFFVPSTSGLAVLSMPVLAPLSDFAGVSRDLQSLHSAMIGRRLCGQ